MDNSSSIARTEVRPNGFNLPLTTFEDMMIEYIAYDYDGNVAICQVNTTVHPLTPFLARVTNIENMEQIGQTLTNI